MANIFTYLFHPNKEKHTTPKKASPDEVFSPSDKSVKSILDFAKSYEYADLKHCDEKDLFLN